MNLLSDSTSLYLKQHAENPVHWRPWNQAALDEARSRNIPILVSIGYSACHWCHVMAHESFEHPATSSLMNDLYVNIKVDREERPDLDKIYQLSHQLLTGRGGGWPLTVFLDPVDLTPFFAGTYFPVQARHGLPAFAEILKKLRDWFDAHRADIKAQNIRLQQTVASIQKSTDLPGELTMQPLDNGVQAALANYDHQHGGFGAAPKFPQAPTLAFINTMVGKQDPVPELEDALHRSLEKMGRSGLRDHLDGGFFRYTVDGEWTIPHFEKMLYDNALLLPLYAQASARLRNTGRDGRDFADIANGIVSWLDTHMQSAEGGYCASIDADADGVEGGFHVWTNEQIRQLLSAEQYHCLSQYYGLDKAANFESKFWHLTQRTSISALAANGATSAGEIEKLLDQARVILARNRDQRVHPTTDPKRLTGWNALVIDGLVKASIALDIPEWGRKAITLLDLLIEQMWVDKRLYTVRYEGQSHFPAYLDDHAWLLQATLNVLKLRWHPRHYLFAIKLGDTIVRQFTDPDNAGFFFTASDEAVPLQRIHANQDDATPGAAGSAIMALLQLGHLSGNSDYLDAAHSALQATFAEMSKYPMSHSSLLNALNEYLEQPAQVIITGTDRKKIAHIHQALLDHDGVHCYAFVSGDEELPGLPGAFDGSAEVSAFVCRNQSCLPAVDTLEATLESLGNTD